MAQFAVQATQTGGTANAAISVHISGQQEAPYLWSQTKPPAGWSAIPYADRVFQATDVATSVSHIMSFSDAALAQSCFNVALQAYQLGTGFTVSGTGSSLPLSYSNTELNGFKIVSSCALDATPSVAIAPPSASKSLHISNQPVAPVIWSQLKMPAGWSAIPHGDRVIEVTDGNTSVVHIIDLPNTESAKKCYNVALQAYQMGTGFTISGSGSSTPLPGSSSQLEGFKTLNSCSLDVTPAPAPAPAPAPESAPTICSSNEQYVCPVSRGQGTRTCSADGKSYSACQLTTCNIGYAPNGNGCVVPRPGIESYLVQLYRGLLGRGPDVGGYQYWKDSSSSSSCAQLAANFILSSEFQKRNQAMTDQRYLQSLYRGLLGRTPDAGGFKYWVDALASGFGRGNAASSFLAQEEFDQKCVGSYGFPSGAGSFGGI